MNNCVVYIDYDNIKYSKYDKIMSSLFESSYNINIKIFINENDLNNLDPIIKIKNNIFLCSPAKNKKNSIDCHIMIECMDDIYSNKYDCHIIISNDTDFIPLAKRIKSENKKCFLCYDNEHNFNSYLNDIYDNTYNLSHLLKLENDKKKYNDKDKNKNKDKNKELLDKELLEKELLEKELLEKELLEKEQLELIEKASRKQRKELRKKEKERLEKERLEKEKELKLKIQKEKEEKENKQKEINKINEIKKIEKLSQKKKSQISPILEEIFNNNIIHISINQFQKMLDKKNINYKKDVYGNNIKYKKYLETYMPNIYIIKKDDNIYLK